MTKVREVMTTNVFAVTVDSPVLDVVRLMVEKNIGSVVVFQGENAAGIITQRDVMDRVVLRGLNPQKTKAEEIMSAPLITTSPDEDVDRLIVLLSQKRIKRLPVMSGKRLLGIISTTDIIAFRGHAVNQALLELYRKHAW